MIYIALLEILIYVLLFMLQIIFLFMLLDSKFVFLSLVSACYLWKAHRIKLLPFKIHIYSGE